ncbi:hypothetical protein [Leeia oryzae]|uniref:hypothetical protein n=1 Tax=Leeia oryzae TaxID=356662 RepID=UPI0003A40917|nr:hypothetical protein [Leeia oryzae]
MLTYNAVSSAPHKNGWLGPLLLILALLLAIGIGFVLKTTQKNRAQIYMPEDLARMRRMAAASAPLPARVHMSPQVKKPVAVPETYKLDTRLDNNPPDVVASSPDVLLQKETPPIASQPAASTAPDVTPLVTPAPDKAVASAAPVADPASAPANVQDHKPKEKPADAKLPADQWLSDIQALKQAGHMEEVASSLQRFKSAYPDYPLPDDLQ